MKKANVLRTMVCLVGVFAVLLAVSCATSGTVRGPDTQAAGGFTDVMNKDWALAEVRVDSTVTVIDRSGERSGAFTLRFDDGRASGMALPNRFVSPYVLGEGSELWIGAAAGTLMAPLFEQPGLTEREYLAYLAKVRAWYLRDGRLELTTSAENGSAVILVFRLQ